MLHVRYLHSNCRKVEVYLASVCFGILHDLRQCYLSVSEILSPGVYVMLFKYEMPIINAACCEGNIHAAKEPWAQSSSLNTRD